MSLKTTLAGAAFVAVLATGVASSASAATLSADFFSISNPGNPYLPSGSGDFATCCSSPPATLPVIAVGSSLGPDHLPVTTLAASGGGVVDQNGAHEIQWWTPGTDGIVGNGTGTFTLGKLNNMFANGTDDTNTFETAIVYGTLTGSGADAKVRVGSDDDAFVYLDGVYQGGNPGVHPTEYSDIDLGSLTGKHSLEVFYADRSVVGANLEIDVMGAAVPEPATWATMLLGIGMIGAGLRMSRRKDTVALTAA